MKNCILLGDRSDIGKALVPYLEADGYRVNGWHRDWGYLALPDDYRWDLIICALGRVAPVGNWWELNDQEFIACIESNLLLPIRLVKKLWSQRNPGASVCFMAGSNPQKIMSGYLPYNMSKMALLKAVEQIDYESPDCKVFALGPGYVKTKIHAATLAANWPNERIARGDDGTPIGEIWECLKWCIAQPKEAVGGRNICVSDEWDTDPTLPNALASTTDMFKLRRIE